MDYAAWHSVVTDDNGKVVPMASITVRHTDTGALARLYNARDGSEPKSNPFQTGADGMISFFAAGGAYTVIAAQGSLERRWPFVPIGTAQEYDIDSLAEYLNSGVIYHQTFADMSASQPLQFPAASVVLADPDGSKNGYYTNDGSGWLFARTMPDSIARATIYNNTDINSPKANISQGINPSSPIVFFLDVASPNTGSVTLTIDGIGTGAVLNAAGNILSAGEWLGRVMLTREQDGRYRIVNDPASAIAAANSASTATTQAGRAESEADRAEAAAAGLNLPSIEAGDAGKTLIVNNDENGYNLQDVASSAGIYDTKSAAEAASIPSSVNAIRLNGYYAAGDGGGATYSRSDQGFHGEGYVQSSDGAWWKIDEHQFTKAMLPQRQVPDWTDVIHTIGMDSKGDGRGADYERNVPNASWFSEDLRLSVGGNTYVNRRGWQRCIGKRYGRIVVAGSSTPAGTGATGYFAPSAANGWTETPSSWVGLMRAAIGDDGEIINRSVQGWNTQSFIDRFWRDIAPYAPDTVIISTGYVNEPSATPESRRAADVYARILRLCGMCARIGAKPIVMITMAGSNVNLIRTYAIATALRQNGITVWDISTAVKDRDSNAIAVDYTADGTHANDAGHLRYFQNININDLEVDVRGATKEPFGQVLGRDGYYLIASGPNTSDEYAPLTAIFTGRRPLDICAHVRVRGTKASGNTRGCILNMTSSPGSVTDHPEISVRVTADTNEWGLFADGVVVLRSGVAYDRQGFTSAIVSYDRGRNRFDYYHDYTFVGSHTPSAMPSTDAGWTHVRAGSSSNSWHLSEWEIHDFTVMRNPAMNGWGIKGSNRSMEFSLPLPCTMGARFSLASMEATLGVVNNVELDGSCRLVVNRAYARPYNGPLS